MKIHHKKKGITTTNIDKAIGSLPFKLRHQMSYNVFLNKQLLIEESSEFENMLSN